MGPGLTALILKVPTDLSCLFSLLLATQGFLPFMCHLQRLCILQQKDAFQFGLSVMLGMPWPPKTRRFGRLLDDPNAREIKDIYGLCGQGEYKLAFLRTHVPKEMKLVVISHSVGCYFSLQILKHAPELPIIRCFLLFPATERMTESPNSKLANPLLCWL